MTTYLPRTEEFIDMLENKSAVSQEDYYGQALLFAEKLERELAEARALLGELYRHADNLREFCENDIENIRDIPDDVWKPFIDAMDRTENIMNVEEAK